MSGWTLTIALVVALTSAGGCSVTVTVDRALASAPAVEPLPVAVGVHYDETFLAALHENNDAATETVWTIPIGACSTPFLDSCFDGMFEQVTTLDTWTPGAPIPPDLDGVIVPRIGAFEFTTHPFEATAAYRLTIYSTHDDPVHTDVAYGHGANVLRSGLWPVSQSSKAESAVEQAIRAAAAEMLFRFPDDAGVQRWLRHRGVGSRPRERMFGSSSRRRENTPAAPDSIVVIPIAETRETEGYASISHRVAPGIEKKLRRDDPSRRFIDADLWRDSLFPWFERSTMPTSDGAMAELLSVPVVRRRLDELGVRHFILVRGAALDDEWEGPMLVGAGFGAAGVLGVTSRDEAVDVSAVIWDVASRRSTSLDATEDGSSTILGLILPVPFFDSTESRAIEALATEVVDQLSSIAR